MSDLEFLKFPDALSGNKNKSLVECDYALDLLLSAQIELKRINIEILKKLCYKEID
jgi:hypothetical protein